MDSETANYLLVLVAGTGLTITVGTILQRYGRAVLTAAYPESRARGLASLVTVGYFLFALGILSLISTIDIPVTGVIQTFITKIGVVLIILGLSYAGALVLLGRLRQYKQRAELDADYAEAVRMNRRRPGSERVNRVIEGSPRP